MPDKIQQTIEAAQRDIVAAQSRLTLAERGTWISLLVPAAALAAT